MGIGVCGTKGKMTASDGLQLRRIRSFLHCLTKTTRQDNNGHITLTKNCTCGIATGIDNRRKHSTRRNVTSKTSQHIPLPWTTMSAATSRKFLLLPLFPPLLSRGRGLRVLTKKLRAQARDRLLHLPPPLLLLLLLLLLLGKRPPRRKRRERSSTASPANPARTGRARVGIGAAT